MTMAFKSKHKPDPQMEHQSMKPDDSQEMGGSEDHSMVAQEHGPADEVTMRKEGDEHHVHSKHPDGHMHHSVHGSHEEAMHATSSLMGESQEEHEQEHSDPMGHAAPMHSSPKGIPGFGS